MTSKDKLIKAQEAFERIRQDANHGISCDDHDIMNPENYKKEMRQHGKDVKLVRETLATEIKACDSLGEGFYKIVTATLASIIGALLAIIMSGSC